MYLLDAGQGPSSRELAFVPHPDDIPYLEILCWNIPFSESWEISSRKTIVSKSAKQLPGRGATLAVLVYSAMRTNGLEGLVLVGRPENDLESVPRDHLVLEAEVSMVLN